MAVDVAGLGARWARFAEDSIAKAVLVTKSPASTIKQSGAEFRAFSTEAADLVVDTRLAFPDMDAELAARMMTVSRGATSLTTMAGLVGDGVVTSIPAGILKSNQSLAPQVAREAVALLESSASSRLTRVVRAGDVTEPIIEARDLLNKVIPALNRRTKNSVVVSGIPGSGRSTAVHALVREITAGTVPGSLTNNTVRIIQPSQLRAGGATAEDIAKRLSDALNGAADAKEPTVVFIDRFEDLADNIDAGLIVRNAIEDSNGKLRVVLLTNDAQASKLVDAKNFGDYATLVKVDKTKSKRAIEILDSKWASIEAHHGIQRANRNVSVAAVSLAENYLLGASGRDLMGLSVDVADAAASKLATEMFAKPARVVRIEDDIARLQGDLAALEGKTSELANVRRERFTTELADLKKNHEAITAQWDLELPHVRARVDADREIASLRSAGVADDDPRLAAATARRGDAQKQLDAARGGDEPVINDILDEDAIVRYIAERTGIPEETLAWDAAAKFRDMPDRLKKKVVGQDHVVDMISAPFRKWKAGGKPDDKPVGVLFVGGPSGVGKTELAVQTTLDVYGDKKALTRIPGGDFDTPAKLSSLVGSPQGYIGSDEGGRLTNALAERPHSMFILDEGDKMHGENYRFILNLDDTGTVVNGKGYEVDATNAFFMVAGNWMRDEMDMLARNWATMTTPEKEKFAHLFKDWIAMENTAPDALKTRLSGPFETLAPADQKGLLDMFRLQLMTDRVDPATGNVIAGIKPEVLNRAQITLANPVSEGMVDGGARLYIKSVAEQQLQKNGVEVEVADDVIKHLVEQGNVPGRGVRLVQNLVRDNVTERLSEAKLNGELLRGDVAVARMKDGEIVLDITRP